MSNMPLATSQVAKETDSSSESSNAVASLVKELIDINTEMFDVKETIVAKGVPYNTLNALVELSAVGKSDDLQQLKESALQSATSQFGAGAVKPLEFDQALEKLVELEEDLAHVRKISRGRNMDPQATNVLTNVIRQNPGDRGEKVLNLMFDYATACEIKVDGRVAAKVETLEDKPESVLPDIKLPDSRGEGWQQHKRLIIDIAIGLVMSICALALLV